TQRPLLHLVSIAGWGRVFRAGCTLRCGVDTSQEPLAAGEVTSDSPQVTDGISDCFTAATVEALRLPLLELSAPQWRSCGDPK
ncbi:hypothetical protein V5799_029597, partial [Amblyomma americanum]